MMEIFETDAEEYGKIFPSPYHCYNSVSFNLLNEERCEKLLFLVFKDSKNRLGLITGLKNKELYSPYSAPFGGFSFVKDSISLLQLDACVDALLAYIKHKGYEGIHYTMPPLFYNKLFNNKVLNVLYRKGFNLSAVDLNYQFDIDQMDEPYESNLWYNAQKNLKIANKQNFNCMRCETDAQILDAYNVIKENRERKQYPLKMTFQQVRATAEIIEADFFILKKEEVNVAAAQVFKVAAGIVQIIYWGDIPDFAGDKPMNFLACYIFNHYRRAGIKYIDIGPSSELSQPNYGLCEFKEGIGCTISPKFSFKYSTN
jgi:hypothetical protein